MEDFIVNYGLIITYVVLGIGILSALVFPTVQMFQDIKKAMVGLIGLGGLFVVYLLCYVMAKAEAFTIGETFVSADAMKIVEANLFMTYLALLIALLGIGFSSVSHYFK